MVTTIKRETPSSIEIAQHARLSPISAILDELGLGDEDFDFYGLHTGKLKLEILKKLSWMADGKLILVTAMTPTRFGEGKTLTSIGLGQALKKIGKRGVVTLREPSLGPVFGIKGGAAGGGYAQVLPMEKINLHFNGDLHAVTAAHNLLAAMLDNHIYHGNEPGLEVSTVAWPRALDMNDRSLRQIVIGLGGKFNGVPRESGFVITAASEVMAILALAGSRDELKARLGRIVVGYSTRGLPVTAQDLMANNAMAALLDEAIMPNLVQTIENTPAIVHAGPFANIAHGTNSVIADRIALKLADYVITECGFGADLGAEKFFHIVNRSSGLWPSVVVLVATCRAIKLHGGIPEQPASSLQSEHPEEFRKGLDNLLVHIRNIQKFGLPVVVALNRFPFDTEREIELVRRLCDHLEVDFAPHEAFLHGGDGAIQLAESVVRRADSKKMPEPRYLYDLKLPHTEKVRALAREVYRADGVYFEKKALKKLERFEALGYGMLPICVAKTQASLSDNPKAVGVPKGWTLTVTDAQLSAGAGFVIAVCGEMTLMPGLPKSPAATRIDVDAAGVISGLF